MTDALLPATDGAGVLLIGGGLACQSAAETLRREGYQGRIQLVGAEPVLPYDRTLLSKSYLMGEAEEGNLPLRPASYFSEYQIETLLGTRVKRLDVARREAVLTDGTHIPFEGALLAPGCRARRLDVPGGQLPGVLTLRSLADARVLREELRAIAGLVGNARRVVVIGAGFIGAEVASACRALGTDVTLLEALDTPLQRAVGPEIGELFAGVHRAHGVDLRTGVRIAALEPAAREPRVGAVVLSSGERVVCDLVVVGVGAAPETEWLRESGIALDDGILVDAVCQTSQPGIFAAGDAARWPYTPAGSSAPVAIRQEHWDHALRQGECAARGLMGRPQLYTAVPYVWSDQYDLKIQMVGYTSEWQQVVLRGEPESGSYIAFYLADGWVRAALAVNRPRELATLKKLVSASAPLDPAQLADDMVALKALLPR